MTTSRPVASPAFGRRIVSTVFLERSREVHGRDPDSNLLPFEAIINGVPSHIIDVSVEGLRIRTPPDHTVVLPPQFVVSVPLMGVSIHVRRVWTRSSSGPALGLYYGVSLLPNRSSAIQGWRSLIETIPGAIDAHDSH